MKAAEYKSLDFDSLLYGDIVTSAEAMSDVERFDWPESVKKGSDRIVVTVQMREGETQRENVQEG